MKKCLFGLVFVLCVVLCASAWAEDPKSCQCCCSPNSDPAVEETSDPGFEYTQAVELDGFTLYLPAEFEQYKQSKYRTDDTSIHIDIYRYLSEDGDAHYEDLDEWRQYYEYRFANLYEDDDDTVRRVLYIDDLAAFIIYGTLQGSIYDVPNGEMDEYIFLSLSITNGEKWLKVYIYTETAETAEQLAEGIASHVVLTNTAE